MPASAHLCHCPTCKKTVPPKLFGCKPCWTALPMSMQRAIWAHYVPGQEISKDPSPEYIQAARAAVEYLRIHHVHGGKW